MIELNIKKTSKKIASKENYTGFDQFTKHFDNLKEAKQWLKEEYGNCKKEKMYVDLKSGGSKHIGYVYSFRNADMSHYPISKWLQQDWVEIIKVEYSRINL